MSNHILASEWRRRIKAWKRSGQTAGEYGARHGIDPRQLYWWSWRLRKKGAANSKGSEPPEPERVRMLPVRVVEASLSAVATTSVALRYAEVALVGDRVLRIAEGVDPDWAARLVVRIGQESRAC
jgi:hypothetical protein